MPGGPFEEVVREIGACHRAEQSRDLGGGEPAGRRAVGHQSIDLVEAGERIAFAGLDHGVHDARLRRHARAREAARAPRRKLRAPRRVGAPARRACDAHGFERLAHMVGFRLHEHEARLAGRAREAFRQRIHAFLAAAQVLDLEHDDEIARAEQRDPLVGREDLT